MSTNNTILVTGGAGFIGSNFVLQWIGSAGTTLVNLDLLTYAGNPANLSALDCDARHHLGARRHLRRGPGSRDFARAPAQGYRAFRGRESCGSLDRRPWCIHSHKRAGDPCAAGTGQTVLVGSGRGWTGCISISACLDRRGLRLPGHGGSVFSETTAYSPNSPYAASKAASDHLARAYFHTYGLPVLTTNCSNNYGPFQFPEKLIPLMILNALEGKPLPVYGDGGNVRDWLFVEDHCAAIRAVLERGKVGETYNIGGNSERRNLDVVTTICDLVDEMCPDAGLGSRRKLVTFVTDRPGHDRRYAIDASKISRELGWRPEAEFETGLRKTVAWYLENSTWVESVRTGAYLDWIRQNYQERIPQ